MAGLDCSNSATAPATIGAAAEVPDIRKKQVQLFAVTTWSG